MEKIKSDAKSDGYTQTFFGRRRYFEGLRSKIPFIKAMAERMAINAPIQGTLSDFIKLAMVKTDEFLRKEKIEERVKLILQVHDELVYEAEEDVAKTVAPQIRNIMENIIAVEKTKGIIMKADISIGDNWRDMEEVKI